MLNVDDVRGVVRELSRPAVGEAWRWARFDRFFRGEAGTPDVREGAGTEVKDLARLARKNVIGLVVHSFAQNLSVEGYRSGSEDLDSVAWSAWQAQRMDARQASVHMSALKYGLSYVVVSPMEPGGRVVWRPKSPSQLIAVYRQDGGDAWPVYAVELWDEYDGANKIVYKGALYDEEYVYPLVFGEKPLSQFVTENLPRLLNNVEIGQPFAHGAGVCPVVRFVNAVDDEGRPLGEVEPLIRAQCQINEVNFDRLLVARFGAFPQKVISGWSANKDEILQASSKAVWAFEDPEVKAQSFPPAMLEPYNAVLQEMMEHVAMTAQISPATITGKMINLSAEALAAGEANQQRKLAFKRDSLGESWEQVFQLDAALAGRGVVDDAEVVWRDTEVRAFGAVVDGLTKLAQVGVPISELLGLVPSLSQSQVQHIRDVIGSQDVVALEMVNAARKDGDL